MPSASRKIEKIDKIDKIFSVRTSAWRSVRKQKRKRAEVTVLYEEKVGDEGVREKKDEGTIFYGVRTSG